MQVFVFILGVIAFLVTEHPIVFWCVFVPLALIFVISLIAWIARGGLHLSYIILAAIALLLMIAVLVGVCIPDKNEEHEHGKIFSFQFQGSTAMSYIKPWCKSGDCGYLGHTDFRGTPSDLSYLDIIKEYIDADEVVGGEYYTMVATVTAGDHDYSRVRINCKVQSEDIIVGFSVEFRDEFKDAVASLKEGDIVKFRGRYYDEGCGFTDCELITE